VKSNPLLVLESLGQSIWIDFIRRQTITSGELKHLIEQDGVSGVTSNPSIYEKAIAESDDYDESIRALSLAGKSAEEIYQRLTVEDIQMVADQLRATYDQTDGRDGFVSLEVSPILAHDTMGTIEEARQLWSLVNRANVMIKVPATREGLPAIQQLTAEGINVNITLLFGLPRYRQVVDAYLTGLERLASTGKNLKNVASVASFFLSRIDTLVDTLLEKKITTSGRDATVAGRLQGQVATASAKVAYQIYKEIFGSDRFRKLQDNGARTQKLLWASTSTKNPAYSDTKYIEPLIGPDTINTLPIETLNAYREHGLPRLTLDENRDQAYRILQELPQAGINLDQITQDLEQQGVEKFRLALDRLMASLQEKQAATASSL